MRILINGWFSDQLATGSGQYLSALAEWLPRVSSGHEFILVRSGRRGAGEQGGGGESQNAKRKTQTANSKQQIADASTEHAIRSTQYAIRHSNVRTPFDGLNANLAKLWFEQIAFPRACRRLRADVAFVPYWGAAAWSPCPVVVTIHDLIPLLLPLYRGGPLQRGYTALVSLTARRAAAVLTDSEASKRDIVQRLRISPERVYAIPLAANSRYRPVTDPAELARVAARYRLPEGPFLLYVGGFDARKNLGRMVEAFAKLAQRQIANRKSQIATDDQPLTPDPCLLTPDSCLKLVIAGKLPEADTAFAPDPRRVAAALGVEERVHFTGWVDETDKPALYSMALGTVFASEYEGFGLPVLEAMACNNESGAIAQNSLSVACHSERVYP
ncbi:MAG: glycosyltransferase family 1 protein [Chloroflexi bacterium]|nr:glycosyltransferase family 1 protein [Chloroflexota bacterium]